MKKITILSLSLFLTGLTFGQETPDTTRIKLKGATVLIIEDVEIEEEESDTIDAAPDEEERNTIEAHFAGIEFGPTVLLNSNFGNQFPNDPQWENDPGRSFSWNFNVAEHKFSLYKNYIGITTGLGFNITQIGLKQYILNVNADSISATIDTVETYQRNKLRGYYLQVPLMLEFCTSNESDEGFYLAAGVIGGLRIGSSVKRTIDTKSRDVYEINKGTFGLDAFRLDAAVKLGYKNVGVFANYDLLPLFNTSKTVPVYPLTFGLACNF